MPYNEFMTKVGALARSQGMKVRFHHDQQEGLYIARFHDGLMILGNGISKKVTAKWASGHMVSWVL